ncbi:MAG TPA: nuclear transport factor 2 family protein [Longimicrobiaceae bacterium]|nr:nuclear transport factor 2 family protein [Longimicrobiaceae bacterium]
MTNEQLVRSLYEAFARGDGATVVGALDPGIVWMEAENVGDGYDAGNPYVGPQRVAAGIFGRLATEWDGFQVRPETFVSEGNHVVALGRYRGTYKATTRPLNAQFVHVWTIEDGKVTRFQQYTDTAQFTRVTQR